MENTKDMALDTSIYNTGDIEYIHLISKHDGDLITVGAFTRGTHVHLSSWNIDTREALVPDLEQRTGNP